MNNNENFWVAVGIIFTAAFVAIIGAVETFPTWQHIGKFIFIDMTGEASNEKASFIDILAKPVSAVIALVGIYLLYQRTKAVEKQTETSQKQLIATDVQNQHDKFIIAVEMMSDKKQPYEWYIGLNLLFSIVNVNHDFHQTAIQALIQIGRAFSKPLRNYNFSLEKNGLEGYVGGITIGGVARGHYPTENEIKERELMLEKNNFVFFILKKISEINTKCNKTSFSDESKIKIEDFQIKVGNSGSGSANHFIKDMSFENILFINCNFSGINFYNCNFYDAIINDDCIFILNRCLLNVFMFKADTYKTRDILRIKNCFFWQLSYEITPDQISESFGILNSIVDIKPLPHNKFIEWQKSPAPRIATKYYTLAKNNWISRAV